jgi:hypothetical protein
MARTDLGDLDTLPRDRAIGLVKSLSSMLPGFGPLIASAFLDDIPGQRMDRFQDAIERLAAKVDDVEAVARCTAGSPGLDILEDGMTKAVRAFSEQQRDRLMTIVAYGLADAERRRAEARRLLDVIAELDDEEIILLASHDLSLMRDPDFTMRHRAILTMPQLSVSAPQEAHDANTVKQLGIQRLIGLGLLVHRLREQQIRRLGSSGVRESRTVSDGIGITALGNLVLRRIGLVASGRN